jgi:hypothetical protein
MNYQLGFDIKKYFLLIVGFIYWYLFYFRGAPAIAHGDWVKEQFYLDTLRSGVDLFLIPWSLSESFYHGVTLFMANPETTLTPDVFFLRILSNNQWFYLHHSIFYLLGFISLNRIAKDMGLASGAYIFLYLVFNYNGYITSHISEGHFQWTGYYLIPTFMYLLYKSQHDSSTGKHSILAGIVLGVLFANGSFHIAIWLSLFALALGLFNSALRPKILACLAIGYSIGAFRVIPALIYFPPIPTKGTISGYTDMSLLLNAITQLRGHGFGATTLLGWWEYNLYIGFTAFFLLLLGAILFIKYSRDSVISNISWIQAGIIIFLLSLGNTWGILSTFSLPFGSIERTSSRFIVIPFLLIICAGTYAINKWITNQSSRSMKIFFFILLIFITIDLFYQFLNWSLITAQQASGGAKALPSISVVDIDNYRYKNIVYSGWFISIVALLVSIGALRSASKMSKRD